MKPEDIEKKLDIVKREDSPFYGSLVYNSSSGAVPAKVQIFTRESTSSRSPRLKYVFATRVGEAYLHVSHESRLEMN